MPIILASQSPRRRELLTRAGVNDLKIVPSGADETIPDGMPPQQAVCVLAERKALWCAQNTVPGDLVIAADTVVYIDGEILGKPQDERDAVKMLKKLSGRQHEVFTGVCVVSKGGSLCEYERTAVWFRELREREILAYIKTGEPMDKAGAYGIQDYGALLVSRIEGDFYNVMGLPLCRLNAMLSRFGAELL